MSFTNFALKISIYSGNLLSESDDIDTGKTSAVFINLMDNYLDKGYHVFADNYHNLFYLAKDLSVRKTYVSGAMRKDRKGNSNQSWIKTLKKGELLWKSRERVVILK